MENFDELVFNINCNFSLIISSVSNSGKTTKAVEFLLRSDEIVKKPYSKIIVLCSNYQKIYKKLEEKYKVVFVSTVEEAEQQFEEEAVILIDDKLSELDKVGPFNQFVTELFCRRIHHEKLNVILLVQVLFSKHMRTIFNNTTYIYIGKFIKDRSTIIQFGKQFCPHNTSYMQQSYELATSQPFGFLLVDLNVLSVDKYRLRNSFFPSDTHFEIYVSVK